MRMVVLTVLWASFLMSSQAFAISPSVVASIKPIHSLVAGVMAGVGEPEVLIAGVASEHGYALRPSQMRLLEQSDLVFWVGPQLETFLIRPLSSLPPGVDRIALSASPGVQLLAQRDADTLAPMPAGPQGQAWDMHIWLDPDNAIAMVREIAARLQARDPDNAAAYGTNAAAMEVRLAASKKQIQERLAAVPVPPYIVYHDAYQYFENRFGLRPAAIISPDPERQPGAGRVRALRKLVQDARVACVFTEPQYEPRLIETLTEGADVHVATLDPLGSGLPAGADLYFQLLDRMADTQTGCAIAK
jgi:zinc transport system substrate-binding protein